MKRRMQNEMYLDRADKTAKYSQVYQMFRRAEEIEPERFYSTEIEKFERGHGGWAIGCCPFHGDNTPSFAMHMHSGGYVCHATSCGERGGDIVSFVGALHGLSRTGAAHWLEEHRWI